MLLNTAAETNPSAAVICPLAAAVGGASAVEGAIGRMAGAVQGTDLDARAIMGALESLPEGVSVYGADRRLVVANLAFSRLHGLPDVALTPGSDHADVLSAIAAARLFKPDHAAICRNARAAVVATGAPMTYMLTTQAGRLVHVTEHPLPSGGWISIHTPFGGEPAVGAFDRQQATDRVTGLLGEAAFASLLDEAARHCAAGRAQFALLSIGIDDLGALNDIHGRAIGDQVLRAVRDRVRALLPPGAPIGRPAGGLFGAVVWLGADPERVLATLGALGADLARPFRLETTEMSVPTHVGLALAPSHGTVGDDLWRRAEIARHAARRQKASEPLVFEGALEAEAVNRVTLERELRAALEAGAFSLVFQPIVNLNSGVISAAEALLRWHHPRLGPIRPDVAIAVAEETGLIRPLGEWVLSEACHTAVHWPESVTLGVNISALQLDCPHFVDMVLGTLKATGMPARRLMLEVTETVLLDRRHDAAMRTLSAAGVRFALDDFGVGYASFQYLIAYRFDQIKIDRSFIADLPRNPDCQAVVRAVIAVGAALGKEVVVEGVETETERQMLADWGHLLGQGYLFAPGLSGDEIQQFARLTFAVEDAKRLVAVASRGFPWATS
ncbi:putative bifunctional diguanylate cyclase/phosphodiesterase [Mongoliimonas terrestris]|uniref:putative bifunctional diguanylate cyclase/phosphodiesterase n=1 Tax=Mongoliimonas terrestris TaxID=1709001 RepID=UPI0009496D34|nr:EAL domain-containing protein [Mongoliimonas terrestris]